LWITFLGVQNGTQGPALTLSNEHVASLGAIALFGNVTGTELAGKRFDVTCE